MRVVALVPDLLLASRIEEAARAAGAAYVRIESPDALPPPAETDLLVADWSARGAGWGASLAAWSAAPGAGRLIVFGRHTDLESHAAARAAGLGPMWARSKLVAELPRLVGAAPSHRSAPNRP